MSGTLVFRWRGDYFGMIEGGSLFDDAGHHLGRVEGGTAWHRNGAFLGEVIENRYVLRNIAMIEPQPRAPSRPSAPPTLERDAAVPVVRRAARAQLEGWIDALDQFREPVPAR
jgi:4-fold beta flower protein